MVDGADGVELDVQRCRSGEIVVFHDKDLHRLARRPERICDLPLVALREVVLDGGEGIPTLAEALEACGPHALVNVELKHDGLLPIGGAALVAGVADVVVRADAASRVLVSSFSPGVLWLWHRRLPEVACGLLFEPPRRFHRPWPLRADVVLPVLKASAVHPHFSLCDSGSVRRWQRRGYAVNVWTVDDPDLVRGLAAQGVDALIANDPAAARAALRLTLGSTDG